MQTESVGDDDFPALMTVGEVLQLEVIQRAGPTFYGSAADLQRPVRWVHTGEIADIAQFLAGGEAILTGGLGFGTTPQTHRAYIRSLARAHVAVVVLEVAGRAFTQLPATVLTSARRWQLPIITVEREFPFAAVTAQVHRRIVNNRFDIVEAIERVGHEFGELLARDTDPPGLVRHLADVARCPVVLETAAGQMRAYAGGDEVTDDLVMHWERHWTHTHAAAATDPASPGLRASPPADAAVVASPRCLLQPVVLRGQPWGYLHVLLRPDSPAIGSYLADRAATFVAIALLNERVVRARRTLRQAALINRLRSGDVDGPRFVREALTMGIDLRDQQIVALALDTSTALSIGGGDRGDSNPGEAEMLALRLSRAGVPVLAGDDAGSDVLVMGLGRSGSLATIRREAASAGMSSGLSRPTSDPSAVLTAITEARQAMAVAAAVSPGSPFEADQLGLYGLLVDLAGGPALRMFVEQVIGSLLPPVADADRPLLPTLQAYADSGFNKAEAAKRLHVQRRTLYYRLERIAQRLTVNLDEPEARTRLSVALAGWRLLGPRAGGHAQAAARVDAARGRAAAGGSADGQRG